MNSKLQGETAKRFRNWFGSEPTIVSYAPGRVEVLGNHTDYNEGLVLSAAIDRGTCFAIARNGTGECRLVAGDLMKEVRFDVAAPKPSDTDTWSNYCKGVVAGLLGHGKIDEGFNALFFGDVPQGAGLSSSAALEIATALAVAGLYSINVSRIDFARIGQKAEHEFAGVKCGLLDQISSLFGEAGKLVKTDFRTLDVENVDLGGDCVLLVCKSGAKHALVDGAYNERRSDCEEAAAYFKEKLAHPVTALRDVSWAEWEALRGGLPDRVARRAAHPIGEDERVVAGSAMLAAGDVAGFGRLMFESHRSSVEYFENSCEELDAIVDSAKKTPGVLGARLSGGGFGGSVVALVGKDAAKTAAAAIAADYAAKYGKECEILFIEPSQGARIVFRG